MPLDGYGIVQGQVTAEQYIGEREALRAERSAHEAEWRQISRYIFPDSTSLDLLDQNQPADRIAIYDNTAELALDSAAAGLYSLLTNPASTWLSIAPTDYDMAEDDDAQTWCAWTAERALALYRHAKTQFGLWVFVAYQDLCASGTSHLIQEERWGGLPVFRALPVQQTYIVENEHGEPNGCLRDVQFTPAQVAERFPRARYDLPKELIDAINDPKRAYSEKWDFLHCIKPRRARNPAMYDGRNRGFASTWVCIKGAAIVEENGYHSYPVATFRLPRRPGEKYGRGLGAKALPDTKQLQRVEGAVLDGLETVVYPPLQLPDDSVLGDVSLRAGALNHVKPEMYLATGGGIRPITTGARPDIGEEHNDRTRERIRRAMLQHLLEMMRDPRMTATHVLELKEEQTRGQVPIIAALEPGLHAMVERTLDIGARHKYWPPAPQSLAGREVGPQFESPAARTQRLAEVRAMLQGLEAHALVVQANPEALDNLDTDEMLRFGMRNVGSPHSIFKSKKDIAAIRAARQEQMEDAAAEESAKNVTTAVKNMAPAVAAMAEFKKEEAARAAAPQAGPAR